MNACQLHPAWRHETPAAYAVFVPEGVHCEFDDYAVFCDKGQASAFVENLADLILNDLGREPIKDELTIYSLHAIISPVASKDA